MSTTGTAVIPTCRGSAGPASRAAGTARTAGPVRRSVLPRGACPAPTAALPAVTLPPAAGAGRLGQSLTEGLPAAPSRHEPPPSAGPSPPAAPSPRTCAQP